MGSKNDYVFSTVRIGAYCIRPTIGYDRARAVAFGCLSVYPGKGVRPLNGDVGEGVCDTPLPVRPQKLNPYVFSVTLTDEKNEPRGRRGSKNMAVRITAPKCGFKKRSH